MSEPFNPLTNLQNNLRLPLERSSETPKETEVQKKKSTAKKHKKKSSLMTGETTFRARGFHKTGRQNKSNDGLCFDTNHFGAEMLCHSPAMNMTGLGDIITPTFQLGDENACSKNG